MVGCPGVVTSVIKTRANHNDAEKEGAHDTLYALPPALAEQAEQRREARVEESAAAAHPHSAVIGAATAQAPSTGGTARAQLSPAVLTAGSPVALVGGAEPLAHVRSPVRVLHVCVHTDADSCLSRMQQVSTQRSHGPPGSPEALGGVAPAGAPACRGVAKVIRHGGNANDLLGFRVGRQKGAGVILNASTHAPAGMDASSAASNVLAVASLAGVGHCLAAAAEAGTQAGPVPMTTQAERQRQAMAKQATAFMTIAVHARFWGRLRNSRHCRRRQSTQAALVQAALVGAHLRPSLPEFEFPRLGMAAPPRPVPPLPLPAELHPMKTAEWPPLPRPARPMHMPAPRGLGGLGVSVPSGSRRRCLRLEAQ